MFFVALREIRSAPGRFGLITTVVLMMAVLVTFLSSLTAGLAHQSVSAADRYEHVVVRDDSPTFDASRLTPEEVAQADGIPLGIDRSRLGDEPVLLIASPETPVGQAIVSQGALDGLSTPLGATTTINGHELTVSSEHPDEWLSHQPVVYVPSDVVPFVSAVGDPSSTPEDTTMIDSRQAVGSYSSESGSLLTMTALLFVISALVVGAFFAVWTMQRLRDISILKALGASSKALIIDALGQAAIVLAVGISLGAALSIAALSAVPIPVSITPRTTLIPVIVLFATGLVGAGLSMRLILSTPGRLSQ